MSQPDETHGCPYCGDEHPTRRPCAMPEPPPLPPIDRAGLRRAEELLLNPDRMAAFTARLRSLAPAVRPASTAGGSPRLTDETPGPALDLFGRLAR